MSCPSCDGRPQLFATDVAEELGRILGPRYKRDSGRTSQYGGKGIIKFNPSISDTQAGIKPNVTLLDWQSEDGRSHQVTVEIGRIASGGGGSFPAGFASDGITPLSYRAYAQVIVGQPATMEDYFYLDVGRGQRFTVSASYVAVTLIMGAPPPPPQLGPAYVSGSLGVFAGLGYGTSLTLAPVVFTQYVDALPNSGTSSAFIIPPRASLLLPVRSNDVNNQVELDFLDNAGSQLDVLQFTNGSMITPAPIAEDEYSIIVKNQGTVTTNYRLVYQLSI